MMHMDESRKEIIREEAKRAKAIAVEKYKAGDFAGAKEFALKAKQINPALGGLRRLNALLDVCMGFQKQVNGEVDWYDVLAVERTADFITIFNRYSTLAIDISLDRDESVGSGVKEALKILTDASKYFLERRELLPSRRVSGPVNQLSRISCEGSKQKEPPPTNLLHVSKLRRMSEDAEIRHDISPNRLRSALARKATSVIKLSLETFVCSSPHNNVGAAEETDNKVMEE
ncbi:unnamed protein product [Arabidopsis thaliana]|uniref:Uncharacterized protein n=2 Tax=Arabidopsis TaxID=3701 RepID=A0A654G9S6_ARATH|nr:hypothetical protein ISN44_As05g045390 [Arabidopsis suecica]VYS69923.1 unnamed protein product [Arabidopsis thaliana]